MKKVQNNHWMFSIDVLMSIIHITKKSSIESIIIKWIKRIKQLFLIKILKY